MNSTITLSRAELQAALDALLVLIGEEVYVAAHHVKVLAALHMALAKPASDDSKHLNNLLCRIHRDGGHYQGQHGTDKAVADADLIVARLYASEDKPVAVMELTKGGWEICDEVDLDWIQTLPFGTKLYTHPAPANQDAQAALIEAKNTILWLQRRLAKGYEAEDIPHVKRCIAQIDAAIAGEKK